MHFFLDGDKVMVKEYADSLNVLFHLRGDYFAFISFEHSVAGQHSVKANFVLIYNFELLI